MEHDFWLEKWQQHKIGFHRATTNDLLLAFYDKLELGPNDKIFVPLCGKSVDLLWLQQQDLQVFACELSELAVTSFFEEHKLPFTVQQQAHHKIYQSDNIHIAVGDLFTLPHQWIHQCQAIYDRAAIIALPQNIRQQYTALFNQATASHTKMLILSLEYPQQIMPGPPFSVSAAMIRHAYEDNFVIETLYRQKNPIHESHLIKKDLTQATDCAYLLSRHPHAPDKP